MAMTSSSGSLWSVSMAYVLQSGPTREGSVSLSSPVATGAITREHAGAAKGLDALVDADLEEPLCPRLPFLLAQPRRSPDQVDHRLEPDLDKVRIIDLVDMAVPPQEVRVGRVGVRVEDLGAGGDALGGHHVERRRLVEEAGLGRQCRTMSASQTPR